MDRNYTEYIPHNFVQTSLDNYLYKFQVVKILLLKYQSHDHIDQRIHETILPERSTSEERYLVHIGDERDQDYIRLI